MNCLWEGDIKMGKRDFGHKEKKKIRKGTNKPLIQSEFEPTAVTEVIKKRKPKEDE